ncbi:molybdopterin-dependent oxidoreductase [bacterium]|nr:molybdopterin-dependent oxidoreductase [bacterium]
MKTRRAFISVTVSVVAGMGLLMTPGFQLLRTAYGKVKKRILPADTKLWSLIQKNPSQLDARNLPETPLSSFQTMGETEHNEDLQRWRLEIAGRNGSERSYSYQEMLDLPSIERTVLLICPGYFAQQGRWKGIDMAKLLDKQSVPDNASKVIFSGPTGTYKSSNSFPIDQVRSNQVFLAYQVNGKPLPEKHGFPLRVVAEDAYGSQWVKYVDSVKVT